MQFDPASEQLKCPFCGQTAPAPFSAGPVAPHPLEAALAAAPQAALSSQALQVTCQGCGSAVVFEPPEVAGVCPFCGSPIVAEPKTADPLIAPDAVLVFKLAKTAAQESVTKWLASRWFAPNALKRMAHPEHGISGVYLPFWSYSTDTRTAYRGERGEYYYVTEDYEDTDGQGHTVHRTRQVRHTRWYPASGEVARRFEDELISATRAVVESHLNALQPWDLSALRPYDPAYLAGFKAQRYQLDLAGGFDAAKQVMAVRIEQDAAADIGGDEQRVEEVKTEYANSTFRHLLLPVWVGAYRFGGKVYQLAVNARAGSVHGDRPWSVWKIGALVLAVLALLLLAALLLGQH
jgi:ribosomal protein S27E